MLTFFIDFFLGIPTYIILTGFGAIVLSAIVLTAVMATLAVRHCRDRRFDGDPDIGQDDLLLQDEEEEDEEYSISMEDSL